MTKAGKTKEYQVHPLILGEAQVGSVLDIFWSLTKNVAPVKVPVLAFLIEGGSEPILVDTGMRSADRAMNIHKLGPHSIGEDNTLAAQLARFGYKPEDIKTVLITHLHYDHAGGCEDLPNARIIVQRSELAAAAAPVGPRGLEIGNRELFYDREDIAALVNPLWERVELIEGDVTPFPGIDCILYPNTHTPGSQCIYVNTPDGVVSIVGDIVRKVQLNVGQGIPPGLYYDLEQMLRAMRDIGQRSDLVLPTHDPMVLEEDPEKRLAALRPEKPWP